MSIAEALSHVKRIDGVCGYILIDGQGEVIACSDEMKSPENLSKMVYSCGRSLSAVGKNYFKYASFSRACSQDILIFPVRNYYLGVVKQTGIKGIETAESVVKFLNVLAGKRT